jgi:two-component system, NarL family, nitrate/nitrite response regulator NarL
LPHEIFGSGQLRNRIAELKGSLALSSFTHRSDALGHNTDPSIMMARKHSIRIVIADDHPVVLEGLGNLIASDANFALLASCPDGEQCLRAIRHFTPDIAVVDMAMPIMNGLEVLAGVIAERLSTRVVFLAASFKSSEIVAAAEGGAFGIMLKDTDPEAVLHCLREVAAGRRWLPPELIEHAVSSRDRRSERAARFDDILTEREQQIMFLVAEGLANKEIAERLGVSEGTVKIHLHNTYKKLPVSNRTALANLVHYYRGDE